MIYDKASKLVNDSNIWETKMGDKLSFFLGS